MTSDQPQGRGVALYVRVSTVDQDLDGQRGELEAYAATRGWRVVATYQEKLTATGRVEREQFELLQRDARANVDPAERGWGHVLVWALDRWSRDPSFVRAIGSIEELEQLGVRWHSFKEPQLDSSSDGSSNLGRDLLRGILPTIAAFEARRRSERTRLAMQEIRAGRRRTRTGRAPGRPLKMTPKLAARIVELRKRGGRDGGQLPWKQVAILSGVPEGTCRKVPQALRGKTPAWKKVGEGFGT